MNKKELDALLKCAKNINYFCKYVQINTVKGRVKFKPYSFQKKLLKKFTDTYNAPADERHNNIVIGPRQIGKTTLLAIYVIWFALFKPNKYIGIMSYKHDMAKEILYRVKDIYNTLPEFMKIAPRENNSSCLRFVNGSMIMTSAFKVNSIHGRSFDLLVFDETAFTNPADFDDFAKSVFPTQACRPNSQMIMISTPCKTGHAFHKLWKMAVENKNSFVPTKLRWNCIPYRNGEWRERMIKEYGIEFFRQEFAAEFTDTCRQS